ncbi:MULTISPECIES: LysR substrate-binding domain-containing protein [unclassified Streptomyces]|uniref:LysR substrate-binding domain-containing protein n=1 Tax=unclassified Streptomyces TaxID=2593676 RepID=UPI00278BC60A|nr:MULTISPECIES: LysR substrate-binding domain-containing protein [unclassified Streptomyces]
MDLPRLLDGRLKLRHLILVDSLSEQGSVVAAAAALHVTQPVVTRGLHDLEAILGVELYERGPRGVTPTVFGTAFTEHARAVLAQLTQAARHVSEIADADRGTVTVGTHLAGSNLLLPRAIAALKAHHPRLTVSVREATPETLLVDLEAGRLDAIVGRLVGPSATGTVSRTLYQESVRVVVRAGHPAARMDRPTLEDLLAHPWILPGTETVLRRELEECVARSELELPEERVECTSYLTVRQLLLETDMVAVLPGLIGRDDPRLTALPVELGRIGHRVGVTTAAQRPMGPSAKALMGALREAADRLTGAAPQDPTPPHRALCPNG